MAELREYSKIAAVVLCSNFSVGVPLLQSLVAATAGRLPSGWHGELTEVHHVAKKDAPSGTAKTIAAAMAAAGIHGLPAQEGVDASNGVLLSGIPTHALRLGDAVGTHTVHLAGPGERVEITHTATKREVFAIGAARMAAWAKGLSPGVYVR
jgi:4-hydroxy-tetrahydrodipicolinate reductase